MMVLACLLVLMAAAPVSAQAQNEPAGLSLTVETTRDRFHYRFETPSSVGSADQIPHEFTQTYWADNQWLVVRGRLIVGTHLLESEFAVTPQRSTRGDDFDTFFQPSGDVVVAGTTGGVSLRSWRARQAIGLGRKGGVDWSLGYQYRRDHSDFHPGLKSTTHTQPPSSESFWIYTRETTISETFEPQLGAGRKWVTTRARGYVGIDAAPGTNARLTTYLPDKYPGRTIVFSAIVATLTPTVRVSCGRRWSVTLDAAYTRALSYVRRRQFARSAARAGIGISWNSR